MAKAKGEFIVNESQALRVLDLLSLAICAQVSHSLLGSAFFGAVTFIAGFVCENYYRLQALRGFWQHHRLQLTLLFAGAMLVLGGGLAATLFHDAPAPLLRRLVVAGTAALLTLRSLLTHEALLRHAPDTRRCRRQAASIQAALTASLLLLLGAGGGPALARQLALPLLAYPAAVALWLGRPQGRPLVEKAVYAAGEIASFRLYTSLLLSSQVALYLSMMAFLGMLRLAPAPAARVLPAVLWLLLVLTAAVAAGHLLRHGRLRRIDKNSLFLFGGFLWLAAFSGLNDSLESPAPLLAWAWSLAQAVALAVMTLLAIFMQDDMELVVELGGGGGRASLRTYRSLVQQAAFVIAGLGVSIELYWLEMRGRGGTPGIHPGRLAGALNLLPLGFILLAMFFALLQPLSRGTMRQLRLYREQKRRRAVMPALEAKLRRVLVRRTRKRIGVKALALLLKPMLYHRVRGARRVRLREGPVVFVANHREIYGPIVANLYLPFALRPWIDHRMLEREAIIAHMSRRTFARLRPAWLARAVMRLISPVLLRVLNSVEPIPVYRGGGREVLRTMSRSVTALLEQDNLLIFPENPSRTAEGRYAASGVSPFYAGFVHVAKLYHRQTGRALRFHPVYADPRRRTITIGPAVAYDPAGSNEGVRVSEALRGIMLEMAGRPGRGRRPT